jgi:hypothetical protein
MILLKNCCIGVKQQSLTNSSILTIGKLLPTIDLKTLFSKQKKKMCIIYALSTYLLFGGGGGGRGDNIKLILY